MLSRLDLIPDKSTVRLMLKDMVHALSPESPALQEMLQYYSQLQPSALTTQSLFRQVCWIVYASGFKYSIVKRYWPTISEAYEFFNVNKVARWTESLEDSADRVCRTSGFHNRMKAKWCILNAARILELDESNWELGGLGAFFDGLSRKRQVELVNSIPLLVQELKLKGIGSTTIFHLLKNVGVNIFKPDIHVRRILARMSLIPNPEASLTEISNAIEFLASVSSMKMNEIDTILFYYGQSLGDDLSKLPSLSGSILN